MVEVFTEVIRQALPYAAIALVCVGLLILRWIS